MSRSRWKRAALGLRGAFYRAAGAVEQLVPRAHATPLPPLHLRMFYYRTRDPAAYQRACAAARTELITRGLRPDHRVLDIGCGIGNLAIGLGDYLQAEYVGFDVNAEAVAWCQRAITSAFPAFTFQHANVSSGAYNTGGHLAPARYRFPLEDGRFDFVFLGSVFTHLLPEAIEQYAGEIGRLLVPGGVCVASAFLLNDGNRPAVAGGRSFIPFPVERESGLYRLRDADQPEAAVAVDESFVRRAFDAAGLEIVDVRRGGWWRGESHDQDVITATALR